jgi:hypothetical protein
LDEKNISEIINDIKEDIKINNSLNNEDNIKILLNKSSKLRLNNINIYIIL